MALDTRTTCCPRSLTAWTAPIVANVSMLLCTDRRGTVVEVQDGAHSALRRVNAALLGFISGNGAAATRRPVPFRRADTTRSARDLASGADTESPDISNGLASADHELVRWLSSRAASRWSHTIRS